MNTLFSIWFCLNILYMFLFLFRFSQYGAKLYNFDYILGFVFFPVTLILGVITSIFWLGGVICKKAFKSKSWLMKEMK